MISTVSHLCTRVLSHVLLSATPWPIAYWAPLPMGTLQVGI